MWVQLEKKEIYIDELQLHLTRSRQLLEVLAVPLPQRMITLNTLEFIMCAVRHSCC